MDDCAYSVGVYMQNISVAKMLLITVFTLFLFIILH